MINAQSGVAAEGISEVVPEGVDSLVRMKFSQGIRPTLREKCVIGGADFRAKERVVQPALRFVHVEIGRHDVESPASTTSSRCARRSAACFVSRSNQRSL